MPAAYCCKGCCQNAGSMPLRRSCLTAGLCGLLHANLPGAWRLMPCRRFLCSPVGHGCAHRGMLECDPPAGDEVMVEQVLACKVLQQEGSRSSKGQGLLCAGDGCHGGELWREMSLVAGECPSHASPGAPQRKAAQGSVRQHKLVWRSPSRCRPQLAAPSPPLTSRGNWPTQAASTCKGRTSVAFACQIGCDKAMAARSLHSWRSSTGQRRC